MSCGTSCLPTAPVAPATSTRIAESSSFCVCSLSISRRDRCAGYNTNGSGQVGEHAEPQQLRHLQQLPDHCLWQLVGIDFHDAVGVVAAAVIDHLDDIDPRRADDPRE